MNPHRILLIDDDPAYCVQLQGAALHTGFEIVFFHNLEDGMEALKETRRLKAVILDGRCFLEPKQEGEAHSNFVFHALQQLTDIEHHYNRTIPFCVSSENPEDFREDLDGIARVFLKNSEHLLLFGWLKEAVENLPETAIRRRFVHVFEAVATHFDEEQQELLIDVLQNQGTLERAGIVTNMAILRRLLENLADAGCLLKLGKQPSEFDDGQGSRTRRILECMHPRVLPAELLSQAISMYKTCSKYGNHVVRKNPRSTAYFPGEYALPRLVFTFLELACYLLNEQDHN
jgi:SpoU rRNA methylase family enzyme